MLRSVVWGTRALGETLPAPDAVAVLHGEQGVVHEVRVAVRAVVVAAEATWLVGVVLKKELRAEPDKEALLDVAALVDGTEREVAIWASLEALTQHVVDCADGEVGPSAARD